MTDNKTYISGHFFLNGKKYPSEFRFGKDQSKGGYENCLKLSLSSFDEGYDDFGDDKYEIEKILFQNSDVMLFEMSSVFRKKKDFWKEDTNFDCKYLKFIVDKKKKN